MTAAESASAWLPAQLGRYSVLGELATGGMAQILLARLAGPSGFERLVVLKRILPHLRKDEAFVRMFLDEARIVGGIHHPNVVQVHELERDGAELYLVMEYLRGESLMSLMRRLQRFHETIDPRLAAYIAAEACSGLHAAHDLQSAAGDRLDLVHRDVSPHNVFVTYDGKIKIIDFGIAKSAERITQTRTGELKGKFEYMSPEQCSAKPVDRRTDVFALGAVLYELTTGRRLFKRPTELLTLKAIVEGPIIPPSALVEGYPRALEAIVLRALERSPDERFSSAAEMRRALMEYMVRSGDPIAVPEEALGALMDHLFEERRREKSELIARASETSDVGALPVPEVDLEYAVPVLDQRDVDNYTHTGKVPIHVQPRAAPVDGDRDRVLPAVIAAVVVTFVVVSAAWFFVGRLSAPNLAQSPPPPAASSEPPVASSEPSAASSAPPVPAPPPLLPAEPEAPVPSVAPPDATPAVAAEPPASTAAPAAKPAGAARSTTATAMQPRARVGKRTAPAQPSAAERTAAAPALAPSPVPAPAPAERFRRFD